MKGCAVTLCDLVIAASRLAVITGWNTWAHPNLMRRLSGLTESVVEQAALAWLESAGWQVVKVLI